MAEYRLSRAARRDLVEIGRYRQRRWGIEQRRKYLSQLDDRMSFLVWNPHIGVARDRVMAGLRSVREGRHIIYCREFENTVEIVRIRHDNMDPGRHFSPS